MDTGIKKEIPELYKKLREICGAEGGRIYETGDGFFAKTESLSDILSRCGTDTFPDENGKELPCSLFFDDWYIYSVSDGEKNIYSLFKMREQESDRKTNPESDGDIPGVTVSFIEMDTDILLRCLSEKTSENRKKLSDEINRVVAKKGQRHSEILKKYFVKTESKGAYLIARLYTDFISSLAENGYVSVPEKYSDNFRKNGKNGRIARFIEENNLSSGKVICDNEKIYIEDSAAPSMAERLAILATHCGNTSFFSFAAEVQLHAKFLSGWAKIPVPMLGKNLYESAIRADMSIGDAEFSGPAPYYKKNSSIVKKQFAFHEADTF